MGGFTVYLAELDRFTPYGWESSHPDILILSLERTVE
jgi:hypothetical protein